ncbi:head GIN domain-containing protein [Rickettsiales endosymbiont of Stachyamoeba lipophora]|uniref:hypothetical protein n=1 Tax=Rickettsiales endosymbiont of Stachyamoeba lipophora TaxID=2486578 RepID=UPI000F653F91|nr:hypothetical protein [Rickettsiales endosymbiont of Stachyamoeba lipophora]AZL15782.1 hypothetical protein EF513_04380 [Rickettsiales endosymbiont of Stachyamoeba lipophora]
MYQVAVNTENFEKIVVLKLINYLTFIFDHFKLNYQISTAVNSQNQLVIAIDGNDLSKLQEITINYGKLLLKQIPMNKIFEDEVSLMKLKQHLDFITLEVKLLEEFKATGGLAIDVDYNFGATDQKINELFKLVGGQLTSI